MNIQPFFERVQSILQVLRIFRNKKHEIERELRIIEEQAHNIKDSKQIKDVTEYIDSL